jgi:MFS family permease
MMASTQRHIEPGQSDSATEPPGGGVLGIEWLNPSLFWIFVLRVLRSFTQGYLAVITPLYIAILGYDAVHLGLLFTAVAFVSAMLSSTTGVLADRFGRKPLLILTALMVAGASVGFAFAPNFALLVVAGAIGSLGRGGALAGGAWGPFYPAVQALVAEQASDMRRTTVFGALSFIGVIAAAFGALFAALPHVLKVAFGVPTLTGYRILFVLGGPIGIVMAMVIVPVREARRGSRRPVATPDEPARRPAGRRGGRTGLLLGLSTSSWRLVVRFMVANVTNGFAIGMLGPFVVYWFYRRFGATESEIAQLFFVLGLLSAVPYLIASRVALAMGSVRTIVFTRAIACALLFGVVLMPTFATAAALYALRMVFNVLSIPVRQSYLMGIIDPAERAGAAGIASLPSQAASGVGPYCAGYFMEHFALGMPLEVAAAMQAVNTFLYWLFFRHIHPPEEIDALNRIRAAGPNGNDF